MPYLIVSLPGTMPIVKAGMFFWQALSYDAETLFQWRISYERCFANDLAGEFENVCRLT